jgi:hypothetical protein
LLLECRHADDLNRRLAGHALLAYPPFLLAVFDSAGVLQLHTWDGRARTTRLLSDEDRPISTSSFAPDQVLPQRRKRLAQMKEQFGGINAQMLEAFHKSRDERGGAFSVCMDRDDARTVSFSRIRVDADVAEFIYASRLPDGSFEESVCVQLPRARHG